MADATTAAVDLGDGIKLEGDLATKNGKPAVETDVALRYDLPKDHPLYATRALRVVPAGSPDMLVKTGKIEPVVKAEPVLIDDEGVVEDERDR